MKEEKEIEYPCTDCDEERTCEEQEKYVWCYAWRKWFHQQWMKIKKLFGYDVSNCHRNEGDDDE